MSSPQEASKTELTALSHEEMAPLFLSLQTHADDSLTIAPVSELYKCLDRGKSRRFRGEKVNPNYMDTLVKWKWKIKKQGEYKYEKLSIYPQVWTSNFIRQHEEWNHIVFKNIYESHYFPGKRNGQDEPKEHKAWTKS